MRYVDVVTYTTAFGGDPALDITAQQEEILIARGAWPKGRLGDSYVNVSHGRRPAKPTFSGDEIHRICDGEHAIIDILDRRNRDDS